MVYQFGVRDTYNPNQIAAAVVRLVQSICFATTPCSPIDDGIPFIIEFVDLINVLLNWFCL